MLVNDQRGDRRRFGDYGFTAAELQAWADLPVTDPKLTASLVKASVTPLAQQNISCPEGYVYDTTSKMCHRLDTPGMSPWLIFGGLAAALLLVKR